MIHCAKNRATVKCHQTVSLDLWERLVMFLWAYKQFNYPFIRVRRTRRLCRADKHLRESKPRSNSPMSASLSAAYFCVLEKLLLLSKTYWQLSLQPVPFLISLCSTTGTFNCITTTHCNLCNQDFMRHINSKQDINVTLNKNLKKCMFSPF